MHTSQVPSSSTTATQRAAALTATIEEDVDPRSIRRKIDAGVAAIAKADKKLGAPPAIEDNGFCRVSPIERALERGRDRVLAWRSAGWSHASIARELVKEGFPAKAGSIKLRLNKLFKSSSTKLKKRKAQ